MLDIAQDLDSKIIGANQLIEDLLKNNMSVACSTKFGRHSLVFLHLVSRISNSIPIIWIDTGYNHGQTIQFANHTKSLLELNLHVFHPRNHVMRIPPGIDDEDHASFTEEVKLAPFRRALITLDATHWVSSVRAYQTPHRHEFTTTKKMPNGLTKVHPMLAWSEEDMDRYLTRHKLPLGPEVFDPTKGDSFRECGLHL